MYGYGYRAMRPRGLAARPAYPGAAIPWPRCVPARAYPIGCAYPLDNVIAIAYGSGMDTHTDPTLTTSPMLNRADYMVIPGRAGTGAIVRRMPEWRRRSLEAAGASPFVAVADTTGLVAL